MADTNVIDDKAFNELLESTGGDPSFLSELMDTYFADATQLLGQLHTSLAAGDAEVLRRAAHSLKSNSASFGATALAALARELEMMGKAGNLDGAAAKIARVESEHAQVKAALEKKRAALVQ